MRTEEEIRKLRKHFEHTLIQAAILGKGVQYLQNLDIGLEVAKWCLGEASPDFDKLVESWDECDKEEKLEDMPNATNLPN